MSNFDKCLKRYTDFFGNKKTASDFLNEYEYQHACNEEILNQLVGGPRTWFDEHKKYIDKNNPFESKEECIKIWKETYKVWYKLSETQAEKEATTYVTRNPLLGINYDRFSEYDKIAEKYKVD